MDSILPNCACPSLRLDALPATHAQVYAPELDAWAWGPKMHDRRFTTAAAALGGAIYALGGVDGVQYLASCEMLDPRAPSWQLALALLPA